MNEINATKQKIFDASNGGLDIIQSYYPEAKPGKHFKTRDEKTASAMLKQYDGVWYVKDFGSDEGRMHAIDVMIFEEGISFGEAIKKLAAKYHVEIGGRKVINKPEYKKRAVKKGEEVGTYNFFYNDKFSEKELAVIGKAFTNEVAAKYDIKSCKYYEFVKYIKNDKGEIVLKNGKKQKEVLQVHSTADFPIFIIDRGSWQKIYTPLATEKKNRFRYAGQKPLNHVFGLYVVEGLYRKMKEKYEEDIANSEKSDAGKEPKLDHIIIASGDRDALNVASFGYPVVWLNSETATLDTLLFKKLESMAHNVINIPDLDTTGIRQGRKVAFKMLDLKTVWLPEELKNRRDHRGNACKDFTDFVKHFYQPTKFGKRFRWFDKLIENAKEMRFWFKYIDRSKKERYNISLPHLMHFLEHKGFARYKNKYEDEDFIYIHVDGHIVKEVTVNDIADYVINWANRKMFPLALIDLLLGTPKLKENYLSRLPYREIDFNENGKFEQFWFFPKFALHIQKDKITTTKPNEAKRFVWKHKILNLDVPPRNFVQQPHFKVFKDENGDLDIEILKKDNPFLNFLIQISRIHWRQELEYHFKNKTLTEKNEYLNAHKFDIAGPNLTDDEQYEQKLHLINKIYALGYLMHTYKIENRALFVYAMDNKMAEGSESHGGSGKSLMIKALDHIFLKRKYLEGRDLKIITGEFAFGDVSNETKLLFIDDMHEHFPLDIFFSKITSSIYVNQKQKTAFELKFEDAPKMVGTSNYPPRGLDPSTMRRLLFTVNSDFYHFNKDEEYLETRQVADDFGGKQLFKEFTDAEWIAFYNVMAQAIQFYLQQSAIIHPPMGNVRKRSLISEMGQAFKEWAEVYFNDNEDEAGNLNTLFRKDDAYNDFRDTTKSKMGTSRFKRALRAFCKLKGYEFNPDELRGKDGRIIRKQKVNDKFKAVEMFFIKKSDADMQELMQKVADSDHIAKQIEADFNQVSDKTPF